MDSASNQPAAARFAIALSDDQIRTERRVFAIFMIVAPVILMAATIIHPKHGIMATDGAEYYGAAYNFTVRFFLAHTGYFLTATTLTVAVLGLTRLARPTHPKAAFWGLVLSVMGFVGWGAIDGMDFMTFNAGRFSHPPISLNYNTMQTYINAALGDQLVLSFVFGVFTLLIIGLFVLAVGLHRAGIAPLWRSLLLPIGVVGVISFLDIPPLEIASGIFVAIALLPIAVRQLRAPEEPLSTRTYVALFGAVAAYVVVLVAVVIATQGGIG